MTYQKRLVLITLFAGFFGVPSIFAYSRLFADPFSPCRDESEPSGFEEIGGAFELIDSRGRLVRDTDIITMPTIIYFGYTFCPDVCPIDNARNALAIEILEASGYIAQPVFISIDPRRDSLEILSEFTSIFHERMIGLTGSEEQILAVSRAYRTFFSVQDPNDEYYLIDHTTFSYLVLPEYGTVRVIGQEMAADEVAAAFQCYINNA